MHLDQLELGNFRNYDVAKLELSSGINAFTGHNGMGKTNLLHAIYYLCMGKAPQGIPDTAVMKHDAEFFRIQGHFFREKKSEIITVKVAKRKRKSVARNQVPYKKLSEHVGVLPVVFISPEDTDLVREGSEVRRRFIDHALSQMYPEYLRALMQYNRILKQRNAALKQMQEQRRMEASLLDAYDLQLLPPAELIHRYRAAYMEPFGLRLNYYYEAIAGSSEVIDLEYSSIMSEQRLADVLAARREKDYYLGRTSQGVHRDDLQCFMQGHPLKKYASQGQTKSFVLAMKLAQYDLLRTDKGPAPILLLDDIFDKLDQQRVERLVRLLVGSSFGQLFFTDTNSERIGRIIADISSDFSIFRIHTGIVQLLNSKQGHDD